MSFVFLNFTLLVQYVSGDHHLKPIMETACCQDWKMAWVLWCVGHPYCDFCVPHDNYKVTLLPKFIWTFWSSKSIKWHKLCSMVYSKTTKHLFTKLPLSRTAFLRMRMIYRISPGHHTHETSIISDSFDPHWRGKWGIVIQCYHR